MNNMKKLVKGISWYFKLGRGVSFFALIVSIILILVCGIWYLLGDPNPFKLNNLSVGELSIFLSYAYDLEAAPALLYAALLFLFAAFIALLEYLIFSSICSMLEPIREGRPFHDAVVLHTRRLGWLILISGIFTNVTNAVLGVLLPRVIDLNELLAGGKILHVSQDLKEFDISFIIYGLLMFLLSSIFQHGTQLQQLSDETL